MIGEAIAQDLLIPAMPLPICPISSHHLNDDDLTALPGAFSPLLSDWLLHRPFHLPHAGQCAWWGIAVQIANGL
ncbi:MAG: hypothetical protein H6913_07840 [Altererythrobacter sp.]|nr:hypothetical protein [Altererythrobacter sp.]